MVAARDIKDAEALIGVSTVAAATDKISDAAADIAAIVIRDIGIHPIVGEIFEKVEERLMKVTVNPNSTIIKQTIEDLDLAARMGVDIIAIRRNHDWILTPPDTKALSSEHLTRAPLGTKNSKTSEALKT
jgi:uncharacterized protein with PhoU and TrkA domain